MIYDMRLATMNKRFVAVHEIQLWKCVRCLEQFNPTSAGWYDLDYLYDGFQGPLCYHCARYRTKEHFNGETWPKKEK